MTTFNKFRFISALYVFTCFFRSPLFAQSDVNFDAWIKEEALRISNRCQNTWCDGQLDSSGNLLPGHSPALSRNETLIIFEAAAIYAATKYNLTLDERNGMQRLVKSLAFNESMAYGHWDLTPRHFYTLALLDYDRAEESKFSAASGAPLNLESVYGTPVPIFYGNDLAYCEDNPDNCNGEDTLGLGIWQITPTLDSMLTVLEGNANTYTACVVGGQIELPDRELAWVGNPGGCERPVFDPFRICDTSPHGAVQIRLNMDTWVHDPAYNLEKAMELTRFKQVQLTDPDYQYVTDEGPVIGPIDGIKLQPRNQYDWARIGATIETINGSAGWKPIFLGMMPYQQNPTNSVDNAVLAALTGASGTGATIDNNGDNIFVSSDRVAREVYGESWTASLDKVKTQQQFVDEAPRTYSELDSLLIIDSSGSMRTTDPQSRRLEAANTYVNISAAEDKIGIIDFDGSARVVTPFTLLGQQGSTERIQLENAINGIDAVGGTEIAGSLGLACSTLMASWQDDIIEQQHMVNDIKVLVEEFPNNTISHSDARRAAIPGIAHAINSKKIAILLTDGDTPSSYSQANQCFIENGWMLYTIGFGGANREKLAPLAEASGGYYIAADSSLLDLNCAYQQIRSHAAGEQASECESVSIQQGETLVLDLFEVLANLAQITFTSTWPGSDVVMTLTTPSGRIIDRNTAAADIYHVNTATSEIYTIQTPEPGLWKITLFGADVSQAFEPVVVATSTINAPARDLPIANSGGPYTAELGQSITLDASGSRDPGGSIALYRWDIGSDGSVDIETDQPQIVYQPTAAFTDSLTLTVINNTGYSSQATTAITVTQPSSPEVTQLSPTPPDCVLRYSPSTAQRTLTLEGNLLPYPRSSENLQFRRADTLEESIYFGMEVDWQSANAISLDVARIAPYLWPDSPHAPLQVRLTDYEPSTGGQRPISDWSEDYVVLASTEETCIGGPTIDGVLPARPNCVLRNGDTYSQTLTIIGSNFPAPRTSQNLQFRRVDYGQETIYFGTEVNWENSGEISLDVSLIASYLWPWHAYIPLQVRITDYDTYTGSQVPVSEWSPGSFVLAENESACH